MSSAAKLKQKKKSEIEPTRVVKTASDTNAEEVIDTLVMAFASDPVARWMYPTPNEYLQHFPKLVQAYGGKAFNYDVANYVQDFAGATLWLPPEIHPNDEELAGLLQETMPEGRCETALAAFEELEQYHPDEPHWHLPFIGVEPSQQRNGFGSTLLEERLEKCDEQGVPVYLESTNSTNVSLYLRHGFEVLGTVERGSMPPFIPMVRQPE
jgi:ribosomal protein S18 acetylase RimI-like enzyme